MEIGRKEGRSRQREGPSGLVAGGPLAADFVAVDGAWSVMRKQLRKRGIKSPSQLVWGVHEAHPVCLLPTTIERDPQWLGARQGRAGREMRRGAGREERRGEGVGRARGDKRKVR